MTDYAAIDAILKELERARQSHPSFPSEPVRVVAKFIEEALEVQQAVNNWEEGTGDIDHVIRELEHAGAMVIRCLTNLKPSLEVLEPT